MKLDEVMHPVARGIEASHSLRRWLSTKNVRSHRVSFFTLSEPKSRSGDRLIAIRVKGTTYLELELRGQNTKLELRGKHFELELRGQITWN